MNVHWGYYVLVVVLQPHTHRNYHVHYYKKTFLFRTCLIQQIYLLHTKYPHLVPCRVSEIEDSEYNEFYKSFSKDSDDPMARTHFTAEGEVTFKSILFIPKKSPTDMFQSYGKKYDFIKMFVRRVFITDNFDEMMPKYLSFVKGVVSYIYVVSIV